MPIENESVEKDTLFQAIVESATEYYKLIVMVASAFLGGSLILVEQLSHSLSPIKPTKDLLRLLACGWICLVISIFLIAMVQRSNLRSGKLVLEGKIKEARRIDNHTDVETTWALITLAAGIALIMAYGYLNFMKIAE